MAGQNGNNATELIQTIIFSGGDDAMYHNGISAEDFIRVLKARKQNYQWSEAKMMNHIQGSLRGPAAKWFFKTKKAISTSADYLLFTTNFTTGFHPEFKETYGTPGTAATVDWVDVAKQRTTEPVTQYIARIFDEVFTLADAVGDLELSDTTEFVPR
jgi:hypothetical protein